MSFSVLICTYNRGELLRRTLASLIIATHEKPDQIVVVNGGDEQADDIVRSFQVAPDKTHAIDIQLIKTVNKNLATSRNIGLGHCIGDIVAMTDDDAEVFPDWVTEMKRVHAEHPEAGAVGGLVLGTNTDTLVGKVADVITFPAWNAACDVRTLPGVNISYKRAVLDQIGPQDVTLFRGEDVDYNWRVKELGYAIRFDPAIRVYHYHRPTVKGYLNQHYMYGRAYYLVRRKWPTMYCVYPRGFHRMRDAAKAVYFCLTVFSEPVLSCRKLSWKDRLLALPLLFLAEVVWKAGMIFQAVQERRTRRDRDITGGMEGTATAK